MKDIKKPYTFADEAKRIQSKYQKRLDNGDVLAKISLNREMDRLKEKQEALKAQMNPEQSTPQMPMENQMDSQMEQPMVPGQGMESQSTMYKYGGYRNKMANGGVPGGYKEIVPGVIETTNQRGEPIYRQRQADGSYAPLTVQQVRQIQLGNFNNTPSVMQASIYPQNKPTVNTTNVTPTQPVAKVTTKDTNPKTGKNFTKEEVQRYNQRARNMGATSALENSGYRDNSEKYWSKDDLTDEEIKEGNKQNKVYSDYWNKLNAARDAKIAKGGSNYLTVEEQKAAIGEKGYNDFYGAKDYLNKLSMSKGMPTQTFGKNEETRYSKPGDPNQDQLFGYRSAAQQFYLPELNDPYAEAPTNDPNNPNQSIPNQGTDWTQVANEFDPYRIDDRYDTGSFIAGNAGLMKRFRPDQLSFDRVDPAYVFYEPARQEAVRQNNIARNVGINNIRNTAGSTGQALANTLALQTGLNQNLNSTMTNSSMQEANANAMMYGNTSNINSGIQRSEAMQNYGDRHYVDEANRERLAAIGANTSGYLQRLKQNRFDELGLQSVSPDYYFDKSGNYVSRRNWIDQNKPINTVPIQNNQTITPTIEDNNPLFQNIYEDPYSSYIMAKYGGNLKRK